MRVLALVQCGNGRNPLSVTVSPIPLAEGRRYRLRPVQPAFFVAGDRQSFPLLVRAPHFAGFVVGLVWWPELMPLAEYVT